jgi:hypothetical protein
MDISKSVLPKCGKKGIERKNSNKTRQTGLVRDDSVNLELVKATANCRLSGPSGSQPQRRPVPQIGQDRGFKATFNPVAQVQFEEGAFPEFSQSLLLTTAFEDEDGYEMRNAKREVPGESIRKRSWRRTAGPLTRRER